jgi:hypothetical protein
MAELTLESINVYLNSSTATGGACSANVVKDASSTLVDNSTLADIDKFMSSQIIQTQTVQMTTKDNFLSLYNNQYARNVEVFVGILIVSGILAKMMFYPIVRL